MADIHVMDRPRDVKVKCVDCGRIMTIKRESGEKPPYYCYKCWDKFGN